MSKDKKKKLGETQSVLVDSPENPPSPQDESLVEINGPKGPEPTRYGDWEQKGRCSDF